MQKLSTEILLASDRIDADSDLGAYHLMAYRGILNDYEKSADAWDREINSKAKGYTDAAMGSENLVHGLWELAAIKHKSEIATWK